MTLRLPMNALKSFALSLNSLSLDENEGKNVLAGSIVNQTGENLTGTLKLFGGKELSNLGTVKIDLKNRNNNFALAVEPFDYVNYPVQAVFVNNSEDYPRMNTELYAIKRMPLKAVSRYNYYMSEKEATLRVECNLQELNGYNVTVTAPEFKTEKAAERKMTFNIPLEKIPDGEHTLVVSLSDAGKKTIATVSIPLIKRPYKKGAVQINQFGRFISRDGKGLFPLTFSIGFSRNQNDAPLWADLLKDAGFNYIMFMPFSGAFPIGMKLIERCQNYNIDVMFWEDWRRKSEDFEVRKLDIAKLDAFDNIVCQLVLDEPELYMSSDDADKYMSKMRSFFPYSPVFMNNTIMGIPNRFARLNTDILMLDDYLTNREGRRVSDIIEQCDIIWKAGEAEHKPCYFFLSGGNMHNHYREPSYQEQIASTYGCIASNISGVVYFGSPTTYPGHWRAQKQLAKELKILEPVICNDNECTPALLSSRKLRSVTRKHDGFLYIIAANIYENEISATITLPGEYQYASDDVEVMFEDRKILTKGGVFTDTFEPLSRHVYRVKLK
jgi:hypothetical protein